MQIDPDLTGQQAAEMLGVSSGFLVKLLDDGSIPSREAGAHMWVPFSDLMACKERNVLQRLEALDELAAQAQELEMGY